ncbi:DnaJ C-terminal domain-containing protein [Mycoplana rhizolycopersici]|uniref:J domain-containing protein n=1 Tax=Mycoplana rhizolycopersici TaxID=2746702 RepID=A0ABX2QIA6_9HYPH|nr:DnaJ C-terminal domain-containing protein [Rhizobium rhizolycopersici]NVP56328.1 J domain-containing protein [Rhizobium rhizolycopersici]
MRDPYRVLGVRRDAEQEEIKAAWRTLAKAVHPDQNQDDPFANIRFTEAGRAYDLLRDPDKRSKYDRAHRDAEVRREMELRRMEQMRRQQSARKTQPDPAQNASETAEDMVSRIFGVDARQQGPASGAAATAGATAQPSAGSGTGTGTGAAEKSASAKAQPAASFDESPSAPAPARRTIAAADIISGLMRRIRGTRPAVEKAPDLACDLTVSVEDLLKQAKMTLEVEGESLKVPLAAGTTEGTVIRLRDQGHRINDLKRGDAVVTIRVAPGAFRVDGFDLRTPLPVTIEDAVLGCETTVMGPADEPLPVTVPAWSSSDHVIRIEGQGLVDAQGKRGDLLVEIRLLLWERPDDKMIDLMRSLREGLYL